MRRPLSGRPRHFQCTAAETACWLALFAIGIWYAVFLNHAILHASFMARLLIVPIIAASILIAVRGLLWRMKARVISLC